MKIKNQIRDIQHPGSPTEEVKRLILSLAANLNLDVGYVLPQKPLLQMFASLNPKQKDAYEQVMNELVAEGIFEASGDKYFLTAKGKNEIY